MAHAEHLRTLDPERIREAIAFGERAADADLAQYELERDPAFVVNCDTPFLRVAQLARAMKESAATLEDEEVSPKLAAELLHVYVHTREDGPGPRAPEVESIVLAAPQGKGLDDLLFSPLSLQPLRARGPAGSDPSLASRGIKAVFPLRALAPGVHLTIRFEDGSTRRLPIEPAWLKQLR